MMTITRVSPNQIRAAVARQSYGTIKLSCRSRPYACHVMNSINQNTSSTTQPSGRHHQQSRQQQQLDGTNCTHASLVPQPQRHFGAHAAVLASMALFLSTTGAASAAQQLHTVADLDAATAHTLESILRPLFAFFTVLYIIRITMTWYPSIDGTKFPWLFAFAPTEPILKITRNIVPLVGGVDITPIVWVALISFFNEILLGPQGILMLIQRESGAGLL